MFCVLNMVQVLYAEKGTKQILIDSLDLLPVKWLNFPRMTRRALTMRLNEDLGLPLTDQTH